MLNNSSGNISRGVTEGNYIAGRTGVLERAARELAHVLRLQNAINQNVVFLFVPNDLLFLASCYTPNTDVDLSVHSAIES